MDGTPAQSFGSFLRSLRRTAGLTQEQLAERAGISARTVSDLERGVKSTPQRATLDLLAGALSLSSQDRSDLFGSVPRRTHGGHDRPAKRSHPSLPAELNTLVGREVDEAAAVHILRRSGVRLLTLIGPGGVGKTRLALRVAATMSRDFDDGARFVSLAAVTAPERIHAVIATSLSVRESAGSSSQDDLLVWLRERSVLLVLDNFEQIIVGAPSVSELLSACPRLSVLVTSRTPLNLTGEHLFEVPPLRCPGKSDNAQASGAMAYSAIALFVQRARAVKPTFTLTDEQVSTVAGICRRLDNLPLAIELAAAQFRLMSLVTLEHQIDGGVGVLAPGPVDAPYRQRTMHDTIAWSYNLLTNPEKRVLRSAAVFVGGFSTAAVAAVTDQPEPTVTRLLESLANQNLLIRSAESGGRYSMLETLRQYGLEKAAEETDRNGIRHRHAQHFLRVALEAGDSQRKTGQTTLSDTLLPDQDNFLAALQFLADTDRMVEALGLAAGMAEYWILWGQIPMARAWMETLLSRSEAPASSINVPAAAYVGGARLAWLQNDYTRASNLYERGLSKHLSAGNLQFAAVVLNNLGTVAHLQNEYDVAIGYYEQARDAARNAGHPYGIGMPVVNMGIIAMQRGEFARAQELFDEGIALWREIGNERMLAVSLGNRASLAFRQNRYDEALRLHLEVLSMKRAMGDRIAVAHTLGDLGWTEIERGNTDQAAEALIEALRSFADAGHNDGVAECLEAMARISLDCNDLESAAELFGAAEGLRETIGVSHHPVDAERFSLAVRRLRQRMDPQECDVAWARGRAKPIQESVNSLIDLPVTSNFDS